MHYTYKVGRYMLRPWTVLFDRIVVRIAIKSVDSKRHIIAFTDKKESLYIAIEGLSCDFRFDANTNTQTHK